MTRAVTPRRTQRERSETTTGELLDAARELFARKGYADTSLDEVCAAAGVTKGALYHHFAGKRALFRAVFEAVQRELAQTVSDAYARKRDPWDAFYAGCRAFLEASLDPGIQRITQLDAPGALGWDTMRELENDALLMVKSGLRRAIREGRLPKRAIDPLAHLIFGAVCEGAMSIARAENQAVALRGVLAELRMLLGGLAVPATG